MAVSSLSAQQTDPHTTLVAAERAFARAAAESSMKEAFLAWLDDEGIIFQPEASNGKKTWSEAPDGSRALLSWDPVWAEVSADGTYGYSTGPWSFRRTPEDSIVATGSFISVWRKDHEGEWKVLVDLGVAHEPIVRSAQGVGRSSLARLVPRETTSREIEKARIHSIETELSARSVASSYGDAISPLVLPDARFYRNGFLPIIGRENVLSLLRTETARIGWTVRGWDIASSLDLAHAWGTYQTAETETDDQIRGNYLRIWRRSPEGRWQIALEVLSPLR
jgi:ketosteroid isomerase-like protein